MVKKKNIKRYTRTVYLMQSRQESRNRGIKNVRHIENNNNGKCKSYIMNNNIKYK